MTGIIAGIGNCPDLSNLNETLKHRGAKTVILRKKITLYYSNILQKKTSP